MLGFYGPEGTIGFPDEDYNNPLEGLDDKRKGDELLADAKSKAEKIIECFGERSKKLLEKDCL